MALLFSGLLPIGDRKGFRLRLNGEAPRNADTWGRLRSSRWPYHVRRWRQLGWGAYRCQDLEVEGNRQSGGRRWVGATSSAGLEFVRRPGNAMLDVNRR